MGFRALAEAGLDAPGALATAEPAAVAVALAHAPLRRPEHTAALLVRASAALVEGHAGSFARLAAEAMDLDDLAGRVARLAPGVGRATVARFLAPLRDRLASAREIPLSRAARAAALHVGLLRESEDEEGEPAALRAALHREDDAPPLADVEAALERLGAIACLRERADRCPLGDTCPLAGGDVD